SPAGRRWSGAACTPTDVRPRHHRWQRRRPARKRRHLHAHERLARPPAPFRLFLAQDRVVSAARPKPPGSHRYWPDGGVDSDAFRARFPDRELLIEMARLASMGRIQFWHPWHMERTPAPERIGRKIVWSATPNGDREWPHAPAGGSHLVALAAGHVLTGSPELLAAWVSHVSQLARSRDRGLHSRWAGFLRPYESELWGNRLDAALRLLNLIRSYDLVRERPT